MPYLGKLSYIAKVEKDVFFYLAFLKGNERINHREKKRRRKTRMGMRTPEK